MLNPQLTVSCVISSMTASIVSKVLCNKFVSKPFMTVLINIVKSFMIEESVKFSVTENS